MSWVVDDDDDDDLCSLGFWLWEEDMRFGFALYSS